MNKRLLKLLQAAFVFSLFLIFSTDQLSASSNEIRVLQLNDDTINPITASYISDAIDQASSDNIQCLIIELDTPGGLLTSTRSIVKKIMASGVPVVVYIYPSGSRAGSAGVFITYASHIAAMAPSTNIGAAHPVELGGGKEREGRTFWDALRDLLDAQRQKKDQADDPGKDDNAQTKQTAAKDKSIKQKTGEKILPSTDDDEHDPMRDKILNDTVAFIRAMARERNRNAEWAVMSVTQSSSITEREALEKNVIELIAKDEQDLLAKLDGMVVKIKNEDRILRTKDAFVTRVAMNFRQRFLNILANPNIAYIFLIIGFYGLLYEVTHPGFGAPGVIGAVFLILGFFSMQILPTNYAGLALIVLAVVMFIGEANVHSFGLLTLGGLTCMILGSILLFDSTLPFMRVSLSIILPFSLVTAAITVFLVQLTVRAHRKKVISGQEGLVGEQGEVYSEILSGGGKVFVHGEIWNAASNEELKKGEKIVVLEVKGMTLVVRKV